MKTQARLFCAALCGLVVTAALPAQAHNHDTPRPSSAHARGSATIVSVAAGNPAFSTLVSAVRAAGLVNTLNGTGPFTVFAPTNEAFDALPNGTVATLLRPGRRSDLTQVLTYHVVSGRFSAADLATAVRVGGGSAVLQTVEGSELTVTARRGGLRLTDAAGTHIDIVTADVPASNGFIHAIDKVLTPG